MAKMTFDGSCYCGIVRFEVDADPDSIETIKCNCTWCWKNRYWGLIVPPADFRAVSGEDRMEENGLLPRRCPDCGTLTFVRRPASDWQPQETVTMSVAALNVEDRSILADLKITYLDGLHDDWSELKDASYL